jgi:hypothetical protein
MDSLCVLNTVCFLGLYATISQRTLAQAQQRSGPVAVEMSASTPEAHVSFSISLLSAPGTRCHYASGSVPGAFYSMNVIHSSAATVCLLAVSLTKQHGGMVVLHSSWSEKGRDCSPLWFPPHPLPNNADHDSRSSREVEGPSSFKRNAGNRARGGRAWAKF